MQSSIIPLYVVVLCLVTSGCMGMRQRATKEPSAGGPISSFCRLTTHGPDPKFSLAATSTELELPSEAERSLPLQASTAANPSEAPIQQVSHDASSPQLSPVVQLANDTLLLAPTLDGVGEPPSSSILPSGLSSSFEASSSGSAREGHDVSPIDLATALAMVGGQHPIVGLARWRVQEAYAQLNQAEVLWLPSIQSGLSFHNHDGNLQASNGEIVDVHRNSFQYGLGVGATGAGTMPRPGIVAQFHLADAYFQPEIAKRQAWARSHAADGEINQQLLTVATAYLELLSAEQDRQILLETKERTADLTKLTVDFAETGQGLQADADRLRTELCLVDTRLVEALERSDIAAAKLAQAISLDGLTRVVPIDPTVVAIELTDSNLDQAALIATGLGNRPELKEARALVAAACEQYKRQQYAPFVPSVLLGFSTGGFGGGFGNNVKNVDNRYDLDALAVWQVRNFGLGEKYARREATTQIQQAKFEQLRVMDQVAFDITEAHTQVQRRRQRIAMAEQAIQTAEESYARNLERIRDGHGLPIEVLQAVRALEDARRGYLNAVIDFNRAQFKLQWALGWTVASS